MSIVTAPSFAVLKNRHIPRVGLLAQMPPAFFGCIMAAGLQNYLGVHARQKFLLSVISERGRADSTTSLESLIRGRRQDVFHSVINLSTQEYAPIPIPYAQHRCPVAGG